MVDILGYFPKSELAPGLDLDESFDTLPDETTLDETKRNIEERNIAVSAFEDSEEALEYLKNRIRQVDDDDDRNEARRKGMTADVFFDSPNAIASMGEIVGVNGLGTSIGAWPYTAKRFVLVSGTNKIVPTLEDAIDRVRNFACPLEDARVQKAQITGA